MSKEPKAYDLHFDEIRQVFVKHLNEWPNVLLSDIAELISTKRDSALEGMVVMKTSEFDEVCRKVKSDGVVIGLKRAEFAVREELKEVKRKPVAKQF